MTVPVRQTSVNNRSHGYVESPPAMSTSGSQVSIAQGRLQRDGNRAGPARRLARASRGSRTTFRRLLVQRGIAFLMMPDRRTDSDWMYWLNCSRVGVNELLAHLGFGQGFLDVDLVRHRFYRVLADHFTALERVHEERFEPTHGPLRAAARRAVGRFLDCGLLEHGFARVRCDACRAEFLVAFRCKGRHFCPSCHARRLAEWSLWLDERLLLAPVAHRQVVLTLPKRLRAYFLYDRRRLGLLSRVACRTLRAYVQAAIQATYEKTPIALALGVRR